MAILAANNLFEPPFRRVYLQKLNEKGVPKIYDVIDDQTGRTYRGSRISYIEEVSTGNLYIDEAWYVISLKCSLIALSVLLYASIVEGFYLIKTPVAITFVLSDTLRRSCSKEEKGALFQNALSDVKFLLKDGIWKMATAPFCALGMQAAALIGVFTPYRGRVWVASIEHFWQRGVSYKEDFAETPDSSSIEKIQELRVPYFANCFQIRGNTATHQVRILAFQAL